MPFLYKSDNLCLHSMRRLAQNYKVIARTLWSLNIAVSNKRVIISECNLQREKLNTRFSNRIHSSPCVYDKTTPSQLQNTPFIFDEVCDETLDSLSEYFEQIIEDCSHLDSADVNFSDGVLTVQFGKPYGTYVINRQTPNQQIWLSSPTSGPKRYDFINGKWIYRHDGLSLHQLLNHEIPEIVKCDVNFSKCLHSGGNEYSDCK